MCWPKVHKPLACSHRQAGEALHTLWVSAPPEELTPEMEQMIDEQLQAVRAQRRKQVAH